MGCGASTPVTLVNCPDGANEYGKDLTALKSCCGPQYMLSAPGNFLMKEKFWSFSSNDFEIKDLATGQDVFKCEGKALSLRDKKTLLDKDGNVLCTSKSKIMDINPTQHIYVDGKRIMTMKKRIMSMNPVYDCYFVGDLNLTEDSDTPSVSNIPDIMVEGGLMEVNWRWYWGDYKSPKNQQSTEGAPIFARAHKDWSKFASMTFATDQYQIEVMPGIDAALVVMMKICIDHQEDSEKKN